jgi:hypothetical protein
MISCSLSAMKTPWLVAASARVSQREPVLQASQPQCGERDDQSDRDRRASRGDRDREARAAERLVRTHGQDADQQRHQYDGR